MTTSSSWAIVLHLNVRVYQIAYFHSFIILAIREFSFSALLESISLDSLA